MRIGWPHTTLKQEPPTRRYASLRRWRGSKKSCWQGSPLRRERPVWKGTAVHRRPDCFRAGLQAARATGAVGERNDRPQSRLPRENGGAKWGTILITFDPIFRKQLLHRCGLHNHGCGLDNHDLRHAQRLYQSFNEVLRRWSGPGSKSVLHRHPVNFLLGHLPGLGFQIHIAVR